MTNSAPFRADQVGSLLRPAEILDAREHRENGEISDAELRKIEDECIRDIVQMQEGVGLKSITDGEFRRYSFTHDFINKIEGVNFEKNPDFKPGGATDAKQQWQLPPFRAIVSERMVRPSEGIEVENFRFLKSVVNETAKICLPSPTMLHFRGGRGAISETAYPDMADFYKDLARIFREEVLALAEAGCRYLQFDDTNLAYLCDENMREGVRQLGEDPNTLPATYAKLISDAVRGRPADMKICIHLCRGNAFSAGFAGGGYEPVADIMFNQTDVDGFFLEYDDERSGGFEPLRFVPKDKKIVLGLVSSKNGELEEIDQLKARVDQAAEFISPDQLCLSPQCGFSSSTTGKNIIGPEEQADKLRLVVEAAETIWG
ncbi:MAG: 5-methyltetrahydropteroyltriglutamate--homocysteine S-methyltransferase [Rhodospirillaceae bacterium]|nr:5-methyltetrahydropteroyltriglutamate--homocysteine S-methyltransferase [Rhodospirillaceae bacterium]